MAVMIESLIGILLFTVLIVLLTLKNPLTSVGDYWYYVKISDYINVRNLIN